MFEVYVWEKTPGMEWGDFTEKGIIEIPDLKELPSFLNNEKFVLVINQNGKIIRDDFKLA